MKVAEVDLDVSHQRFEVDLNAHASLWMPTIGVIYSQYLEGGGGSSRNSMIGLLDKIYAHGNIV